MLRRALVVVSVLAAAGGAVVAQSNRIDTVTPSAPELAPYGKYAIGVRTVQATDKNRPDILNTKEGGPTARYDRTLTLEVWYPAALAAGQKPGGDYRAITRDPAITATLHGQAVRDAAPLATEAPYPASVQDAHYGVRWLKHKAREWNGDPSTLGIRTSKSRTSGSTSARRSIRPSPSDRQVTSQSGLSQW